MSTPKATSELGTDNEQMEKFLGIRELEPLEEEVVAGGAMMMVVHPTQDHDQDHDG